jgi:hypothetical protein
LKHEEKETPSPRVHVDEPPVAPDKPGGRMHDFDFREIDRAASRELDTEWARHDKARRDDSSGSCERERHRPCANSFPHDDPGRATLVPCGLRSYAD